MLSGLCLCYIDLKLFFFKVATLNPKYVLTQGLRFLLNRDVSLCHSGGALVSWLLLGFTADVRLCTNAYAVVHIVAALPSAPHV